jgi:hypothetical protein
MNDNEIRIVGILVNNPGSRAEELQPLFSKFGCTIKTRLGLNVDPKSESALMVLELFGDRNENEKLIASLNEVDDLQVQQMSFD